jgi:hypothetical protein
MHLDGVCVYARRHHLSRPLPHPGPVPFPTACPPQDKDCEFIGETACFLSQIMGGRGATFRGPVVRLCLCTSVAAVAQLVVVFGGEWWPGVRGMCAHGVPLPGPASSSYALAHRIHAPHPEGMHHARCLVGVLC